MTRHLWLIVVPTLGEATVFRITTTWTMVAWAIVGIGSMAAYLTLAFVGASFWMISPLLVLIVASIFVWMRPELERTAEPFG